MQITTISLLFLRFSFIFFSFLINYRHILLALLALELIMVIIISLIFQLSFINFSPFIPILILLTFSACEARLGLALLVLLVRASGNDYVNLLPLFKS